jgi:hypothetical protein
MKKLIIATCFSCILVAAAHAAEGEVKKEGEGKKSAPGQEQKAIRKELTEKYDTDKNGRLNKEEKSKMTAEDLEKWNAAAPKNNKQAGDAKKEGAKKKE